MKAFFNKISSFLKIRKRNSCLENLANVYLRKNTKATFLPSGKKSEEEIVTIGDPSHRHDFKGVDWDHERFGKDVISDPDYWFATYKYLFRCACGAEKIRSEKALL